MNAVLFGSSVCRAGSSASTIAPLYDCTKALSETGFTADLKEFDVPTLTLHSDDELIVPIGASALKAVDLIPNEQR